MTTKQKTAPPFHMWMAEQHLNTDPTRRDAAIHIRDRFGFYENYRHGFILRKLVAEDSPHVRGAQQLADDYARLFNLEPDKQMQTFGGISPLVPVVLEQCNHLTRANRACQRDAVPGTGRCGYHGGQWVTENERAAVVKEISGRLVDISDRAVRVIADLMDNAKSEKVRLDAAIAVLDRVGVGPTQTLELDLTTSAESTAAEVIARLERLRPDADEAVLKDITATAEVHTIESS
jgi:hypothetical protein